MMSVNLNEKELRRYHRQIMIPEIGPEGQEKIKHAKVLVVGAGGLGPSGTGLCLRRRATD